MKATTSNFRPDPTKGGEELMPHLEHVRETMWNDKSWSLIEANCLRSMSMNEDYLNLHFKVQKVDNDRIVIHADCDCVAGRGWPDSVGADCKHSSALYLYINSDAHKSTSKTDVKMTWKDPSKKKLELYPPGQTFDDLIKKSSGFKRNYLQRDDKAILKIQRLMEKHFRKASNNAFL